MEQISIENASPDLSFPWRLYILLRDAEENFPDVIGWLPSSQGRVFQIYDIKKIEPILQKYFTSNRYSSFRRQLIAYGFSSLGNRQYMHAEFYKGNPSGCERVFRHMKSQPRKGNQAASSKQKIQQKSHSYGPTSPMLENNSFISYAKLMMEKISQMTNRISTDTTSPPHHHYGISVSPETLQLSPSAVSPSGGISPPLQCHPQPPLPDSVCPNSKTETGHGRSALTGSSSSTDGTKSGTTTDPLVDDLTEMDLEPLPLDSSLDSSTVGSHLSDCIGCSFDRGEILPEMTEDICDFSKQPSDYFKTKPRTRWLAEDHDVLQPVRMLLAPRGNFQQPKRMQGQMSSTMASRPTQKNVSAMKTLEQLLEPRRIEEMVATPDGLQNWFDYCPSMTPEQQGIIEFMLPVALPVIMYMSNISAWGYAWAVLLIVGHSTECLCTDWGGTAWTIVRWIGPLQHLQMDLLWNHAMITAFFLSGPAIYGRNCYYVALGLVPTLPTLLGVSLKSHFYTSILTDNEKNVLISTNATISARSSAMLLKKKLALQVQRSTYFYVAAIALLALSSFCGNGVTQSLSVFLFNICPFLADFSYWREFAERIEKLPRKWQTLVNQRHVDWLRSSLFRKMKPCDKAKAA